jgi:hypothetical protein
MTMDLSIRKASEIAVGAAIIRQMALAANPNAGITFENVAVMASKAGDDGTAMRASIESTAAKEEPWFRSTPPHTLATPRVMSTRSHETSTLNTSNLATLATLEFSADASAGNPMAQRALMDRYQNAIRAIDEMPGSTAERRQLLASLREQSAVVGADEGVVNANLKSAQRAYLEEFREARLAAYLNPKLTPSEDLDLSISS